MKISQLVCISAALFAAWLILQDPTLLHVTTPALAQPGQAPLEPSVRIDVERLARERFVIDVERLARGHFLASILGALLLFIAAIFGHRLTRTMGRAQLAQQLQLAREDATMKLVDKLGSAQLPVRIASATLLFDRLREAERRGGFWRWDRTSHEHGRILQVLVSVTKEDSPDPNLTKVIGDELVSLRKALVKEGHRPAARRESPLRAYGGERLDLQSTKFTRVFWPGVDARGVDFFGSRFSKAGLRGAFLQGAVFRDAHLTDCVLCDADLRGADLRAANLLGTDLTGAKLKGAKADDTTIWPEGFDYRAAL